MDILVDPILLIFNLNFEFKKTEIKILIWSLKSAKETKPKLFIMDEMGDISQIWMKYFFL